MVDQTDELTRRDMRRPSGQDNPAAIQAQIQQTRGEMEATIDQIQHRLSPERLKRETTETVRDATIGKVENMTHQAEREIRNWRGRATRTIKENPVPVALIGVGLGWLILSDNEDDAYDNEMDEYSRRDRRAARFERETADTNDHVRVRQAREKARQAEAKMQHAADSAREQASDAVESVQESAHDAAQSAERRARELGHQVDETTDEMQRRARRAARRTKRTFWENMNENPLAVGAAAMTIGALVGLALPGTSHEDEWMGEHRDRLVDEAQSRVRETGEQVREVAREARDAAVDTAKEETEKRDLAPTNA